MEEKSSEHILKEFARITNRVIVYKEFQYKLTGIRKFPKYKKFAYVANDSSKNNYFVWLSDPFARVGYPTVISGAFIPLSSRVNSKLNIRNKNVLDKINIFSKTKGNEIGVDYFDSKVVINGDIDSVTKRLLSKSRIQSQLLKALDIGTFMTISINEYNVDFVPELMGKSYLSIINPQSWELERDNIEEIFRLSEKIRNIISEKY